MEELVGKIRDILENGKNSEKSLVGILPLLSKKEYLALPFSESHFKEIQHSLHDSAVQAAFVDGGHAILIESANFCVGFIRVHAVTFKGTKRMSSQTIEAYVIVSSMGHDGAITFQTELLPIKGELPFSNLLTFDSLDETIRLGIRRSSPSAMVGIARRFAELYLASEAAKQLGGGDMVILDGSLQKSYTNEEQLLDPLKKISENKNMPTVIGFCKTNSLFTTKGDSFSSLLGAHLGTWMYAPIATPLDNSPHISFCRLHEKSEQVFMLESFSPVPPKIISLLASFSSDSVFLGYPYGLIEADRAARVSMQEASMLKFQIQERLGKTLKNSFTSKSAHSILDNISF